MTDTQVLEQTGYNELIEAIRKSTQSTQQIKEYICLVFEGSNHQALLYLTSDALFQELLADKLPNEKNTINTALHSRIKLHQGLNGIQENSLSPEEMRFSDGLI